jgi:hypothetical protein
MLGRIVFVLALIVLAFVLPSVSFAGGGVAVAVPSCHANVQAVQAVQVQAYAPVQVAVPVYAQQQFVQVQAAQQYQVAVQAVRVQKVQQVQIVNANKHVRVQVVNQPRTALGAAVQAFRDRRFGR